MSIEDRLREALRAEADTVQPAGTWSEVRARAALARRRRRTRRTSLVTLAAAAAVAIVAVAVPAISGDRPQAVDVGPAAPGTTASTPPAEPAPDAGAGPFVYDDGAATPEAAAEAFAVEYLGMRRPVVGAFHEGGPSDGEVEVRSAERGPVTVVGVSRHAAGWGVTFAATDEIRLAVPEPLATVSSPVIVAGESRAFEGTVQVEVREDGMLAGEALGRGFVTGGAGPEHGHFSGQIPFEEGGPGGAVVLWIESAEDGSVWAATVVRVQLATSDAAVAAS